MGGRLERGPAGQTGEGLAEYRTAKVVGAAAGEELGKDCSTLAHVPGPLTWTHGTGEVFPQSQGWHWPMSKFGLEPCPRASFCLFV